MLEEIQSFLQDLINKAKKIIDFDENEGDVENLVLPVYNSEKDKTEKIPYKEPLSEEEIEALIANKNQYDWQDEAERDAQTGMTEGEIGLQHDTRIFYRYISSSWVEYYRLDKAMITIKGIDYPLIKHPTNNDPTKKGTLEKNDMVAGVLWENDEVWSFGICKDATKENDDIDKWHPVNKIKELPTF